MGEKCFTIFVEYCILLLSKGHKVPKDLKQLIIFPLIIYYSGSSKLGLLLFELLGDRINSKTGVGERNKPINFSVFYKYYIK